MTPREDVLYDAVIDHRVELHGTEWWIRTELTREAAPADADDAFLLDEWIKDRLCVVSTGNVYWQGPTP
jgi:hypothetical protein